MTKVKIYFFWRSNVFPILKCRFWRHTFSLLISRVLYSPRHSFDMWGLLPNLLDHPRYLEAKLKHYLLLMFSPPKLSKTIWGIISFYLDLLTTMFYLTQPSNKQIICFDKKICKNSALLIVFYILEITDSTRLTWVGFRLRSAPKNVPHFRTVPIRIILRVLYWGCLCLNPWYTR